MRFENLQNSRLYKLYRNDQMSRLKRKIQQIKQRKNQHTLTKQKNLLPYISSGYGFSSQRKHQMEKENNRLQSKIKKAKNNHSSYYFNPSTKKKQERQLYLQSVLNTESKPLQTFNIKKLNKNELLLSLKTNRQKYNNNELQKTDQNNFVKSFREQILNLYQSNRKYVKKQKIL